MDMDDPFSNNGYGRPTIAGGECTLIFFLFFLVGSKANFH